MTDTTETTSWTFDGREVELPVAIRHARQWSANWLVPVGAAQAMIDYSGLEVIQPVPGKALFSMAFVDYLDGDLDTYHEVAFSFLVRPYASTPTGAGFRDDLRAFRSGEYGAFIHDLPVDEEFTRAAGTTIWGYPKWIAQITFTQLARATACSVYVDGAHQFTLRIADRGPLPFPDQMPPTYSWRDGVLRRTEWDVHTEGGSARPGGASLAVGSTGPLVRTLRRLHVPRRAMMSSATPHLSSLFGAPEVVETDPVGAGAGGGR